MFAKVGIVCILLSLSLAWGDEKKDYHEHPEDMIEDLFHDLDSTEDANKLIDEVVRQVYIESDREYVALHDQEFDLEHIFPDGVGKLTKGRLEGFRNVIRKGDAQYEIEGDDDVITVRATILFPELRLKYDEAVVQSRDETVRGELRGKYSRLLVSVVISHRHVPDHSNTIDEFLVKGYRESTYRLHPKSRTVRKISLTTQDVMEETRIPLLRTVEDALRKILDEHVETWR